jgi:predicted amidohydrolase YtcJ
VVEPTSTQPPAAIATHTPDPAAAGGDVVFHNGAILTMNAEAPRASAIHIRGDRIVSVGDEASILAEAGPQTRIVDLGGLSLMPGFVDAHSHMFGEVPADPDHTQVQDLLLSHGITTTAEMHVDEGMLQRLQELDARAALSLYLIYTNACGDPVGDWYTRYAPTRRPGEMLRVGGIKIFADGGSCNVPAVTFEYPGGYGQGDLYFTADELTAVIRQLDQAGYQVAVHALGDRALDVVLEAYTSVLHGVNPRRHRIEHNAVLRPDQLPRYSQAGAVATIFGPFQTCITLGDRSRFRYLVPESHQTWEWPWRHLLDANPDVHFAWHGDMPGVFTTDVFQHLYGFVTRNQIAEDGTICQAPEWLASNALTVDEALHLMTLGAAYALDRDQEVGSLEPGKFADVIVLSGNPLEVDVSRLADLQVLMTMVGGRVEYCAEGQQRLCPSAGPGPTATSASEPMILFRDDFDGALAPGWFWLQENPARWSLAAAPGWLRIDLSSGGFLTGAPTNVLLRDAPASGDFELRTRVRVAPSRNFELAGLLVRLDDGSILQFGRGFCDVGACVGDGYYFDNLQRGVPVGSNYATPAYGGTEELLRLVRQGNRYTAYYQVDDSTWIEVGSHSVDVLPEAGGLIAAQATAPGAYAEFDWFEVRQP